MKKKELILRAAAELFNQHGIHEVSIRDICEHELLGGISPSNFVYHFKNKEALIEYHYAHMYDDVHIASTLQEDEGFQKFNEILFEITSFIKKNQFFFTDIVDIFRICPGIKEKYASNYENIKSIYEDMLKHFVTKSLLRKPKNEAFFDQIAHIIWFTMTFWQSQNKVLPKNNEHIQQDAVVRQVWQLLMPYMTEPGLQEYEQLK